MKKRLTIAIDGHSGCGKSTLAKALAKKLGYLYIDSGAMYRAVTWYLLQNGIDIGDTGAVEKAVKDLNVGFVSTPKGHHVTVNGRDVQSFIRSAEVSSFVSQVAAIPAVRKKLVKLQQELGKDGGIVMDGRDIGTVVFPDADLKIFLTADLETRVARRVKELIEAGRPASVDAVRENLKLRDHIDSTRAYNPLRKAEDAVVLDNSHLTKQEQLEKVLQLIAERTGDDL